jgi:hypothetical protein
MRATLFGLLVGLGLAAAAIVPAFACPYHQTNAAADQSQQTAQAQAEQHSE